MEDDESCYLSLPVLEVRGYQRPPETAAAQDGPRRAHVASFCDGISAAYIVLLVFAILILDQHNWDWSTVSPFWNWIYRAILLAIGVPALLIILLVAGIAGGAHLGLDGTNAEANRLFPWTRPESTQVRGV